MIRQSSTALFADAGFDLRAMHEPLQQEARLIVALFDDGRLRVHENSSSSGVLTITLSLVPSDAVITCERTGAAHTLVTRMVCPLGYLETGVPLQCVVDPDRTFDEPEVAARAQAAVDDVVAQCASENVPAMVQAAFAVQGVLDAPPPSSPKAGTETPQTSTAGDREASSATPVDLPEPPVPPKKVIIGYRPLKMIDVPYDVWGVVREFIGLYDAIRLGATNTWLYDMMNQEMLWESEFMERNPTVQRVLYMQSPNAIAKHNGYGEDRSYAFRPVWGHDNLNARGNEHKRFNVLNQRRFQWSWAASYRYLATARLADYIEDHQVRRLGMNTPSDAARIKAFADRAPGMNLHAPAGFHSNEIMGAAFDDLRLALDSMETRQWVELYHTTTNVDVKRVAQFWANYYSHNYNVALALLTSSDFSGLDEKRKQKMRFPTTQSEFDALRSQVRIKSLDSDVDAEEDITRRSTVRVKNRDFHEGRIVDVREGFIWSGVYRRWIKDPNYPANANAANDANAANSAEWQKRRQHGRYIYESDLTPQERHQREIDAMRRMVAFSAAAPSISNRKLKALGIDRDQVRR